MLEILYQGLARILNNNHKEVEFNFISLAALQWINSSHLHNNSNSNNNNNNQVIKVLPFKLTCRDHNNNSNQYHNLDHNQLIWMLCLDLCHRHSFKWLLHHIFILTPIHILIILLNNLLNHNNHNNNNNNLNSQVQNSNNKLLHFLIKMCFKLEFYAIN